MSQEETDAFLGHEKKTNQSHPDHPTTPVEIKSAIKWGHYWPDEKRRTFLNDHDLTAEELDWDDFEQEKDTLTE